MPPKKEQTREKDLREEYVTKLNNIAKQMNRLGPIMIRLGNGKVCPLPIDMIVRVREGAPFTEDDWKRLTNMLLPKWAPDAMVSVGTTYTLPPLKAGGKGVWIRQLPARVDARVSHSIWCITIYGLPNNAVEIYSVRGVTGGRDNLDPVAGAVGVAEYMLRPTYNQDIDHVSMEHVPYENAILFDMLLDIAAGDFKPHQRKITDGPGIQVEILQELGQMQKEMEAASAVAPHKRRLTIQEQRDAKKLNMEP